MPYHSRCNDGKVKQAGVRCMLRPHTVHAGVTPADTVTIVVVLVLVLVLVLVMGSRVGRTTCCNKNAS
jgi:hypothetical protein